VQLTLSAVLKAPDEESHQKIRTYLVQHLDDDLLAGAYLASLKDKIGEFLPQYRTAALAALLNEKLPNDLTARLKLYSALEDPLLFKSSLQDTLQGAHDDYDVFTMAFDLLGLLPPDDLSRALPYLSYFLQMAEKAPVHQRDLLLGIFYQLITGKRTSHTSLDWTRFRSILPALIEQNKQSFHALLTENFVVSDGEVPAKIWVAMILEGVADWETWTTWDKASPLANSDKQEILLERARARVSGAPLPPFPTN